MTNEQLVIRIKAGENVADNMERLYTQVRRFIHALAWRYRDSGEMEDLEQEGYLALYPAIDGYDPDQGVKFLTYAECYIRQRMTRYLQQAGRALRIPVGQDERLKKYKRLCNAFQLEHGRKPSDRETAALMGLALEQVRDIQQTACMAVLASLDSPVTGVDGGEAATLGDLVPSGEDMEGGALDRLDHDRLCSVLWECVDSLEGRQPDILRQRYQGGLSLTEIGRKHGTTPEAARQIHDKALRELRKPRYCERLRPFLPDADRIYSMALHGNGVGQFNRTWTSSTERAALKVMDWEEQRRERMELLERVRERVATSQRISTISVPSEQ